MIKEVIVVEGKSDIQRVKQAIECECIATEGFTLRKAVIKKIEIAYEKRGIIILTDPDMAGERIRRFLTKQFPKAQHAFIAKEDATANNDVGIEQAKPDSIRKALAHLHIEQLTSSEIFSMADLLENGLSGKKDSVGRRSKVGAYLGIGYGNSKQFLYRLNHYGINREDFLEALYHLEEEKKDG